MSEVKAKEFLEYRKGLVCLVPIKGKSGLTSHEKTLCDCQVLEIFEAYDAIQKKLNSIDVLIHKWAAEGNIRQPIDFMNRYSEIKDEK